ncbi:MAG: prolyl aminopeptidase [Xanthomonadales bacterium]|nr:prolyl aminopeptidase [Xanthomonadales bacterium]
MTENRRTLYPEIEPYDHGMLAVDEPHEIYYEQCGNPAGKPVVFLHGGPGGGGTTNPRRFFDPERYHIVLFDQRGCGRSRPHSRLEDNTTWHLVADIEALRNQLDIERWQVFGGSWGSTLALAYAQAHPESVTELVLRGIFLMQRHEIDWLYKSGTNKLFPDAWEALIAPIPEDERGDLVAAYHRRLMADDRATRAEAARTWSTFEAVTSHLLRNDAFIEALREDAFADAFARIETHYFINRGFLERENQLLEDVERIRHIPAVIVHGRYDALCPAENAWELHRAWPEADLVIVPDAGHSAFEPGMVDALIRATDRFGAEEE